MNRLDVEAELERTRADFHRLIDGLTPQDLRRPSDGTRWTNLLWHMVFGYLIVRTLMPLVHLLGRLGWSRRFAAALNTAHRPFHLINYAGSASGGRLLPLPRMATITDSTIDALSRRLANEDPGVARAHHAFPDPLRPPTSGTP